MSTSITFAAVFNGGVPRSLAATVSIIIVLLAAVAVLLVKLQRYRRVRRSHVARLRSLIAGEPIEMETNASELERAIEETARTLQGANERSTQIRAAAREMVNGVGEGLLAIDRSRRVVLANDRVLELFDLRSPVEGNRVSEVVRSAPLLTALDVAFAGEATQARASMVLSGQSRTIEMRVFPIRAESDLAVVALFIDLTEIERLQRIRRDFLADFHHEVRTPLAGLRLALESLQAGPLDETQIEQLQKIVSRQVSRLERLVREVGELNEIESGEIVMQKEPTEMRALIQDLADDFHERAMARSIEIEVSGDPVHAVVDATKAQQIFSNLIDNALKHGSVSSVVRIKTIDVDREALVRVSDEGDGIAEEDQEKIFHRFYRVDKSRSKDVEGTGLGLAIVKHLVLRHGGSIAVISEPGRGATFEVRLPKP